MADDPSVYLRPTKELVDPTRTFDSKKWLWIPDPEEGFKKASVKSTVGEKVRVELTDGQVSVKTEVSYIYDVSTVTGNRCSIECH